MHFITVTTTYDIQHMYYAKFIIKHSILNVSRDCDFRQAESISNDAKSNHF